MDLVVSSSGVAKEQITNLVGEDNDTSTELDSTDDRCYDTADSDSDSVAPNPNLDDISNGREYHIAGFSFSKKSLINRLSKIDMAFGEMFKIGTIMNLNLSFLDYRK